jgi:hypothetical protein
MPPCSGHCVHLHAQVSRRRTRGQAKGSELKRLYVFLQIQLSVTYSHLSGNLTNGVRNVQLYVHNQPYLLLNKLFWLYVVNASERRNLKLSGDD